MLPAFAKNFFFRPAKDTNDIYDKPKMPSLILTTADMRKRQSEVDENEDKPTEDDAESSLVNGSLKVEAI